MYVFASESLLTTYTYMYSCVNVKQCEYEKPRACFNNNNKRTPSFNTIFIEKLP